MRSAFHWANRMPIHDFSASGRFVQFSPFHHPARPAPFGCRILILRFASQIGAYRAGFGGVSCVPRLRRPPSAGRKDSRNGRSGLALLEHPNHVIRIGKPIAGHLLGIDEVSVGAHIEHAASALDQFRFDPDLFFDLLRKTCSFGKIVSHRAIFDGHLHR